MIGYEAAPLFLDQFQPQVIGVRLVFGTLGVQIYNLVVVSVIINSFIGSVDRQ